MKLTILLKIKAIQITSLFMTQLNYRFFDYLTNIVKLSNIFPNFFLEKAKLSLKYK